MQRIQNRQYKQYKQYSQHREFCTIWTFTIPEVLKTQNINIRSPFSPRLVNYIIFFPSYVERKKNAQFGFKPFLSLPILDSKQGLQYLTLLLVFKLQTRLQIGSKLLATLSCRNP